MFQALAKRTDIDDATATKFRMDTWSAHLAKLRKDMEEPSAEKLITEILYTEPMLATPCSDIEDEQRMNWRTESEEPK